MNISLVWMRHDLRLRDNPALQAAAKRGAVVPVFIWSPEEEGNWPPGAASRWWLHQSLRELAAEFQDAGSRLVLRRGASLEELRSVVRETGAGAVYWNRRYEPAVITRDARIKEALRQDGLEVESFNGALLHEPWTIENKSGKPFQVFTPFWRTCMEGAEIAQPVSAPGSLVPPPKAPKPVALDSLELEPRVNWAGGLRAAWRPGSRGARERLQEFLDAAVLNYGDDRNRPDLPGTSRLSPHLHFGEVSPREVWHATRQAAENRSSAGSLWKKWQFITELGWREFSHHLLFHFPTTPEEPLRGEFSRFPWRKNPAGLRAWQKGMTGYPLVDAGMRELWATGWMHNRVRMVVASFLVKDLLVSWQEGARWFWDTLVDADLAQNTLGWQWTSGCGADAAPYFRVFNPVSQGEKFDPSGRYVRHWVPELARLEDRWIHRPWEAPKSDLAAAGVILGKTYPEPVVSHAIAREVALEAYAKVKAVRS